MKIRDVMSKNPFCLDQDRPIQEAAKVMGECDIGFVPVLGGDGKPIGVVTDRDLVVRALGQGKGASTPLKEAMSPDVFCCGPDDDVQDVLRQMENREIRRCVVIGEDGKPEGILAPSDVATRDTQSSDIRELNQMFRAVSKTRPAQEPGGEHAQAQPGIS